MKKVLLLLVFAGFAAGASAQLVQPNRPKLTLDGKKGYITINELAFGYGLGGHTTPYSKSYFGFTTMHAFQSNEMFMVGAGTGVLSYRDGIMIPLYLDMRMRLMQNTFAPYLSGAAGLLINPSDFNGGTRMFIQPSAGGMYSFSRNFAANFSVGLKIQMGVNISRASFVTGKAGVIYKF